MLAERDRGVRELKFLLTAEEADRVVPWARAHLAPDPHSGLDGTYAVHSLYLDTGGLDVFHGSPDYRGQKHRIRRYENGSVLYLERKSRHKGWVQKQRTEIPSEQLHLLFPAPPDSGEPWSGAWFREELARLELAPSCQVFYRRLACAGTAEGLPVRLTLDTDLRCRPAEGLAISAPGDAGIELEGAVLELKFRHALPTVFRRLIREFQLRPSSASKYRRSVRSCGLASS